MSQDQSMQPADKSQLARYQTIGDLTAELWLNVQPGQEVLITGEKPHAELMKSIAAACQNKGSGDVNLHFTDTEEQRARLDNESLEELSVVPEDLQAKAQSLVANNGAFVRIVGEEHPNVFEGVPADKLGAFQKAQAAAQAELRANVMAGVVNRVVFPSPTQGWAEQVFPTLNPNDAMAQLTQELADVCWLNAPDPKAAFLEQEGTLERNRLKFERLDLAMLEFTGPGTSLKVGLSPLHKWLGGQKITLDERQIPYFANVPIGEIFTTPDHRTVSGDVAITVPSSIGGVVAEGIHLSFEQGKLSSLRAEKNQDALEKLIERDPLAIHLGEIAIVAGSSPLSSIDHIFYSVLLDEKMRSHLAVGAAYLSAILDGNHLTPDQQEKLGINSSACRVHHDFMIGSPEVSINGITRSGQSVPLVIRGDWAE